MLACMRLRSSVDLGPGHLEACARTVCRHCLTTSQRIVQVDNGPSFVRGRHVLFFRNGLDWTPQVGDGIKDRNDTYTWGLGMQLRVGG